MCTALHIAVNKGFNEVVQVLTEHTADVNLQVSLCVSVLYMHVRATSRVSLICVAHLETRCWQH